MDSRKWNDLPFLCEVEGYAPEGGAVRGKPTFTLAEFEARFRSFLLDVYHHREGAETKPVTGRTVALLHQNIGGSSISTPA